MSLDFAPKVAKYYKKPYMAQSVCMGPMPLPNVYIGQRHRAHTNIV